MLLTTLWILLMADAAHIPDEAETRARWGGFAWTAANAAAAKAIIARYPPERGSSAIVHSCASVGGTWVWLATGKDGQR